MRDTHVAEPVTWAHLVELEPRLAALEAEVDGADDGREVLCNLPLWYGWWNEAGDFHGFKARLCRLVGWSRRSDEWATPMPGWADGAMCTAGQLIAHAETYQPAKAAVLAEETVGGRGVLWSAGAYDVAYDHLVDRLPPCRGGRCRC